MSPGSDTNKRIRIKAGPNTSNVYAACNEELRRGMTFNNVRYQNGKLPGVTLHDSGEVSVDLSEFDGDVNDVLHQSGRIISADELLAVLANTILKIPIKNRDEFTELKLPDSDLLKVLHYYGSQRLHQQNWRLERKFDETALLQLGLLVERWIDDAINDKSATMFAERFKGSGPIDPEITNFQFDNSEDELVTDEDQNDND